MWKNLTVGLLSLVAMSVISSARSQDVKFESVMAAFDGMRAGTVAPAAAFGTVETFLAEHPNDPLATAYKGSVRARMARDAWMPWRKLGYVNEAFDLLDQAVASIEQAQSWDSRDPKLTIRMVSGSTNAQVPKTFGRQAFAERDFKEVMASPNFAKMKPQDQATVYAWMAVFNAERSETQAQDYLQRARALDAEVAEKVWEKR